MANPSVSRQASRFAYVHGAVEDRNIWQLDLTVAEARRSPKKICSSTRHDASAQFSPDGTRIAFHSNRSGHDEIWVCSSDGTGATQITSLGGPRCGTPRWSPATRPSSEWVESAASLPAETISGSVASPVFAGVGAVLVVHPTRAGSGTQHRVRRREWAYCSRGTRLLRVRPLAPPCRRSPLHATPRPDQALPSPGSTTLGEPERVPQTSHRAGHDETLG